MKHLFLMLLTTLSLSATATDLTAKLERNDYHDFLKVVEEAARVELVEGWEVETGYIFPKDPIYDVEPSPYLVVKDGKGKILAEVHPAGRIRQILSQALIDALNDRFKKEYPGLPVELSAHQHGAYKVEITSVDRSAGTATVKFKFPADAKKRRDK